MELTSDGFLDGQLTIKQPAKGFRSGADAVLLAASVPAQPGDSVLELGVGVGVASLCLGYRVSNLNLTGLELQPDYAELARQNAETNGQTIDVLAGDVADLPMSLKGRSFDHVFFNPPYYRDGAWSKTSAHDKSIALGETHPLSVWVDAGTKRLSPRGFLTMILKATRVSDALNAVDDRLGSIEVKPVAPRVGRAAELIIVRARKGGRADPILHAPLVMHAGETHASDVADPTPEADALLRRGEKLQF